MKWNLTPISEELAEQNTKIQQDVLVGRHAGCDLILQDAKISRKHAIFSVKKNVLWLEDLQSSNGTYVNDEKIEVPTKLNGDEKIQFADLIFQLEQVEEQPITTEKTQQEPESTPIAEPVATEQVNPTPKETPSEETPQPTPKNRIQVVAFTVVAFIIALITWAFFK